MPMRSICAARGTFPLFSPCGAALQSKFPSRHEATAEMWQETYVSALLRAILYSDDPTYWLEAYRKLDPITSPDGDIRFLQAAEKLFMKGETLRALWSNGKLTEHNCRLASRFRSRDPSCDCRLQPPHGRDYEVLR